MTWLSVNQIPTFTGAKWPIASRPATLCRLKLADVTVYTNAGGVRTRSYERNMYEKISKMQKIILPDMKLDAVMGLHRTEATSDHNGRFNGPFWHWPQQNIRQSRSKLKFDKNIPLVFQHHRLGAWWRMIRFRHDAPWQEVSRDIYLDTLLHLIAIKL